MINIESLKDYVGKVSLEELTDLSTKVYRITNFICVDYPKYKEWYHIKQLPETINGSQKNILFIRNPKNEKEIIAMTCLKKTKEEQKICTIYVTDKFRRLGIGTAMIEESMKWLGTTTPLITFPDCKLEQFRPFIKKYGN